MPEPLHIAVNTRLLLPGKLEGIGRFAHEVLLRMVEAHPEARFTFLFDRPFDAQFIYGPNVKGLHIPPPARHPILWHAWFHLALPLVLRGLKPDVFFSPELYLTASSQVPQVPVFHDIGYEHFPEDIGGWPGRYLRKWSPIYTQKAAHILTVSDYTKQDLVRQYSLDSDKISVAYNGASASFQPLASSDIQRVRAEFTQGRPYFLFVGAIHPRKNIARLLRAFDAFKSDTGADTCLVLAGRKGWQYGDALRAFEEMDHQADVIMTGFLPEQKLPEVYGAALALTYVPYFEGFGLPILEAMCCDVPVITSNVTSMPEVVGNAGICVDPFDVEAITQAMKLCGSSPEKRQAWVTAGQIQRQQFSWEKTAEVVWQTLKAVAST